MNSIRGFTSANTLITQNTKSLVFKHDDKMRSEDEPQSCERAVVLNTVLGLALRILGSIPQDSNDEKEPGMATRFDFHKAALRR